MLILCNDIFNIIHHKQLDQGRICGQIQDVSTVKGHMTAFCNNKRVVSTFEFGYPRLTLKGGGGGVQGQI